MPVISMGKLTQEDEEVQSNLGYIVRACQNQTK